MKSDCHNLKLHLVKEMEITVKSQQINNELEDYNMALMQYLFKYAKENDIELPSSKVLGVSIRRINEVIYRLNKVVNRKFTGEGTNRRFDRTNDS